MSLGGCALYVVESFRTRIGTSELGPCGEISLMSKSNRWANKTDANKSGQPSKHRTEDATCYMSPQQLPAPSYPLTLAY